MYVYSSLFRAVVAYMFNSIFYDYYSIFRDVTLCVCSDLFTAFYSGLAVFTVIGFMAHEAGTSVDALAKESGKNLFVV